MVHAKHPKWWWFFSKLPLWRGLPELRGTDERRVCEITWCRNGRHLCLDVLSGSTDHPTFALMCRLYSDGQSVSLIRIFFYNFSSFFYAYLILIIKIFKPSCLLLKLKKKKKKRSPLCWWLFLQFGWLFFSLLYSNQAHVNVKR